MMIYALVAAPLSFSLTLCVPAHTPASCGIEPSLGAEMSVSNQWALSDMLQLVRLSLCEGDWVSGWLYACMCLYVCRFLAVCV